MIDKLPTLPTDTLYKFGTACGFVFMVVGLAGPPVVAHYASELDIRDAATLSATMQAANTNQEIRFQQQMKTSEKLSDRFGQLGEVAGKGLIPKEKIADEVVRSLQLEQEMFKNNQQRADTEHFSILTQNREQRVKRLQLEHTITNRLSLCSTAGAVIFLWSIIAWYVKHQRCQDRLFELEVRIAEKELAANDGEPKVGDHTTEPVPTNPTSAGRPHARRRRRHS